MREERLDLGPKDQAPAVPVIEQRLLSRAVPGQHETAGALVPHRNGKHAVEILDERRPARLIEMDDHLGIGVAAERVAARDQALAQLAEVVDLAFENEPHRSVFVALWLSCGRRSIT